MQEELDPNKLESFNYKLDESFIAQVPVEPRESAKMLKFSAGEISHKHVYELVDELNAGDMLVVNDTKVRPARLNLNKKTGGAAEVLLLEPTGRHLEWHALVRPGKRLAPGTVLELEGEPVVEIGQAVDERRIVTLLNEAIIESAGEIPLPPYIKKNLENNDRYQTVYANRVGSVAAPTAGLHLSDSLIQKIKNKGVLFRKVELEVGLATFKPITSDKISDHIMHTERYTIAPKVWEEIQSASNVIAVGTTVVRTLESAARTGQLSGSTDLFINRGFNWQIIDRLLTNFHVPQSSLLVLVDSFIGPVWKNLYAEAMKNNYRFLSLGDCMLLDRDNL